MFYVSHRVIKKVKLSEIMCLRVFCKLKITFKVVLLLLKPSEATVCNEDFWKSRFLSNFTDLVTFIIVIVPP